MAAAEISYDKDWMRYRVSAFYTSGDANPRDGRARGFDSIVDLPNFAGGLFSFWNREGIRLLGSGVLLTTPGSLIPSLRPSKEEGQANFVNPGIFIATLGLILRSLPSYAGSRMQIICVSNGLSRWNFFCSNRPSVTRLAKILASALSTDHRSRRISSSPAALLLSSPDRVSKISTQAAHSSRFSAR
jgi:hypothetical protein